MRKDMPYEFEVVPMDKGLKIVNTTTWANRDCVVVVKGPAGTQTVEMPHATKFAEVDGLDNGQEYKISISRKDLLGRLRYRKAQLTGTPRNVSQYIVLFGASIGHAWNLSDLSQRQHVKDDFWGYRGYYEFDKSSLVESVLASPVKPDVVVVKECATYFPRDTKKAINTLFTGIEKLKKNGIEVVVATTVPITRKRNSHNPDQMKSINAFNTVLRKTASEKGLRVLDLQAALSDTSEEGFLAERFDVGDGMHLQKSAYQNVLDKLMVDFFNGNGTKKTAK